MRQVAAGFQKSIEFQFHHVVFIFRNLNSQSLIN